MTKVVELDASVDGIHMHTYMVPGCCALRSMHGIDGRKTFDRKTFAESIVDKPTPKQILQGIVKSGIGGSIMILTDAYHDGAALRDLSAFVEQNKLGAVTVSQGVLNPYTHRQVYTGIYEYDPKMLLAWYERDTKTELDTEGWYRATDRLHMDTVFYQYGGRPK